MDALDYFSGQVVRTRWYSTKVFFFDILGSGVGEPTSFMYRRGELHQSGTLTSGKILELSAQVEPGDEVLLRYARKPLDATKGERSFDAYSVSVIRAWKDHGQGEFCQHPPALRPEEALGSVTASSRAPTKGELCKFWLNTGHCQLGSACALHHCSEEERALARKEWLGRLSNERKRSYEFHISIVNNICDPC
jgi:hypothetical protein